MKIGAFPPLSPHTTQSVSTNRSLQDRTVWERLAEGHCLAPRRDKHRCGLDANSVRRKGKRKRERESKRKKERRKERKERRERVLSVRWLKKGKDTG
jgi:hypothetical protein